MMKKFLLLLLVRSFVISCVSYGFAGYALFAQQKAQLDKLHRQLDEAKRSGNTTREKIIQKRIKQLEAELLESELKELDESREMQELRELLEKMDLNEIENLKPNFTGLQ